MRFVDQENIEHAKLSSLVPDGLNAAKQNLASRVASTDAGRIDTGRRLRPKPEQFLVVLAD